MTTTIKRSRIAYLFITAVAGLYVTGASAQEGPGAPPNPDAGPKVADTGPQGNPADALFTLIDRDGNGQISRSEFDIAFKAFQVLGLGPFHPRPGPWDRGPAGGPPQRQSWNGGYAIPQGQGPNEGPQQGFPPQGQPWGPGFGGPQGWGPAGGHPQAFGPDFAQQGQPWGGGVAGPQGQPAGGPPQGYGPRFYPQQQPWSPDFGDPRGQEPNGGPQQQGLPPQ